MSIREGCYIPLWRGQGEDRKKEIRNKELGSEIQ
jgi:hypothetical protein